MNKTTLLIAIAALMTAACTQIENPVEERTPVELQYTTVNATETRAAQNLNEGSFASGESVKVRISNTGAGEWTDYDFTTGNAGAMSPAGTVPYYPAGSQNIDIVAYYPASAGTSFSVQADQTADADYKASDLMFASVTDQAKQSEAVNLAFSHKMAKLNVNITAGSGVTTISGVSILNVKPTVSFDQATGAVGTAGGSASTIAMSNNGAACIPAQTIDGGLLSIVTDKGTATYTVASKEFAAGQQYTLNITVNLRNIGAANAISGWTSEGTVTVVAERPSIAGHEYVEMGDGHKWAVCNVGAVTPWDYGDYFQWGVTVPYYLAGHSQDNPCSAWIAGKTGYSWASYPFMEAGQSGGTEHITKYNDNSSCTYYDDKTTLEEADDAARQRWGSTWRTPTYNEWKTLFDDNYYSQTWQTDYLGTGVKGLLITREEGPCAGNSIFLPAAGLREEDDLYGNGTYGRYWSSSLFVYPPGHFDDQAWYVNFSYEYIPDSSMATQWYRYWGLSIRAVSD